MKDFFISYTEADQEWAAWIDAALRQEGYTTFFSETDIGPGHNFELLMDDGLKESDRMLCVLSPAYLEKSRFGNQERSVFHAKDPEGKKGLLVPVVVKPCSPEGLFRPLSRITLVGLDRETAKRRLLEGLALRPSGRRSTATGKVAYPGVPQKIWNVPIPRNPNFSGRESELERLQTALTSGQPAALCQAIAGLGGVGKSQLAAEYAHRQEAAFETLWWLRCEEPATLLADYAELGMKKLGLPMETDPQTAADQTKAWLEREPNWLLIFDNAEDAHSVRSYLPNKKNGAVLITSRNPNWSAVAKPFLVDLWTLQEGATFLKTRLGLATEATASMDSTLTPAEELSQELGGLPLALEQAAAYMEQASLSPEGYLLLYRKHQLRLLGENYPTGTDYEKTVATTWDLSFKRIKAKQPAAIDLLSVMAYLAADEIPLDLLVEHREALPEGLAETLGDELAMNDLVQSLRSYSLIDRTSDHELSIHRLVQAVVRISAQAEERNWLESAVHWLATASETEMSPTDVRCWPLLARLAPHGLQALEWVSEGEGQATTQAAGLARRLGSYFHGRIQFGVAEGLKRFALKTSERLQGKEHSDVSLDLNNLAQLLKDTNRLDEAEPLMRQALEIDTNSFGEQHPNVATDLNNLAALLQMTNRLHEAAPLLTRAVAILEASFGEGHPWLEGARRNLAAIRAGLEAQ